MLVLIHLDFQPPFFEPTYEQKDVALPDESQLHKAFVDGVQSLEYMYSSQVGKAKGSELVERPAIVEFEKMLRHRAKKDGQHKAMNKKWCFLHLLEPCRCSALIIAISGITFPHLMMTKVGHGMNNVESLVLISRISFCVKSGEGVGIVKFHKNHKTSEEFNHHRTKRF
uniref:Uncharacterized protein n=1 Tax=Globodera rostochiensis TaxID=31243 RepID=A0A914H6J2_GLORO